MANIICQNGSCLVLKFGNLHAQHHRHACIKFYLASLAIFEKQFVNKLLTKLKTSTITLVVAGTDENTTVVIHTSELHEVPFTKNIEKEGEVSSDKNA